MWPSTDGNHVEAANGAGHAYGAALFANERVLVKACVRRGPCDAKRRAPWWHRRPGAVRRVLQCRSRQLRWMATNTCGGSSVSANSKNLDRGIGRASRLVAGGRERLGSGETGTQDDVRAESALGDDRGVVGAVVHPMLTVSPCRKPSPQKMRRLPAVVMGSVCSPRSPAE